jgi:membrane associated rhomboid family serine protease
VSVPPGYPPGPAQPVPGQPPDQPGCFRHPDRPTGLRCTRCDRPACPECLREASVGYQCVECVNAGQRDVRRARTVAGATVQTRPVVVPLMIGLNLGIFLVTVAQAGSLARNDISPLFFDWVTWPLAIVDGNEWWRLVTGGFLHYGLFHIAVNMLALWLLGREIEPLLGWPRFALVYLLSLLGGSTAAFAFGDVDTRLAGASGAVWGVIGAVLVAVVRLKLNPQPVLAMIAINVFISFLPGISLLGHLGGFVVGAALTAAMVYAPRERRLPIQAGAVAGVIVLLGVVIAVRTSQISALLGV